MNRGYIYAQEAMKLIHGPGPTLSSQRRDPRPNNCMLCLATPPSAISGLIIDFSTQVPSYGMVTCNERRVPVTSQSDLFLWAACELARALIHSPHIVVFWGLQTNRILIHMAQYAIRAGILIIDARRRQPTSRRCPLASAR